VHCPLTMMKLTGCVNMAPMESQSAAAVLMVRPARFAFNPQTAASNAFQQADARPLDAQAVALAEFDGVTMALTAAGVEVLIAADTASPLKPDAIFPNNWVSFHGDGTLALYPMMAENRRWERREDILERVLAQGRFRVERTVDLSYREAEGKYLEGTGSIVLDRPHRIAYACLSPRTDLDVLGEFAQQLDYELVTFDASDAAGKPIYHTNVLMAIGTGYAVLCAECIDNEAHRRAVTSMLKDSGHEIILIDRQQMLNFAGNVLELNPPGGRVLALSTTAAASLDAGQHAALEAYARLLPMSIPWIERLGGGGIRCMLAEIHLPKRPVS
jgi:hypothetical protein